MATLKIAGGSLLALGAALALAGCGSQNNAAANQAAANEAAIDNSAVATDNTAAVPPEDVPLPAGDNAVSEDESDATPIAVATVPTPAPTTPAADIVPLNDAIAAEHLIDAGTGITRIHQGDGWAWMQNGQIIRTASADGHRVAYFRGGSTTPYFVQDHDDSYAYSNGKPTHQYDSHGRAVTPDAQHQQDARNLANTAHQQHDHAQQASRTAPHVDHSPDHPPAGGPGTPPPAANTPAPGHQNPPPGHQPAPPNAGHGTNGADHDAANTGGHDRTPPSSSKTNPDHGRQPANPANNDHRDGHDDQGNRSAPAH